MRLLLPALALATTLAGQQQQQPAPRVTIKTGPAVGDAIPAFEATDQAGKTRTLASLTGSKGLMLVFFRSADW
jgi:cytochrome oxidase Cu insertion factor (SCO1/SenC/PrrC family)